MSHARPSATLAARVAVFAVTTAVLSAAFSPGSAYAVTGSLTADQIGPQAVNEYPDPIRLLRYKSLTDSQSAINATFAPSTFGKFTDYFTSPDFGVHVALLYTGKVLLFSFERVTNNPQVEPAPTMTIGKENAGRAYLWDPAKGTGPAAFKAVPPPVVNLPDGKNQPRPAPIFCAGHAYLPNGMVAVFGGNFGGNNGAGAPFSLVFDPLTETWLSQHDMAVGRWYPSVVTGSDGRMLIMSGQTELGWGTATPIVERFPSLSTTVPYGPNFSTNNPVDEWQKGNAPYREDYPQLFALNDGKVYGFGRDADQQFVFDPFLETRSPLANRPGKALRSYGSAVPMPNGTAGPNSVLILGGDRDDRNTYRFSAGRWTTDTPRAFGRTQDDTIILPGGNLLTVNGAYDIRDYGFGALNPNADLKYRQIETRDATGKWTLGPVQRLPRGYHSNAVLLPDGRVMVTGDELQQLASNTDINNPNSNGTIEIYEPPYLFQGPRPDLNTVPDGPIGYSEIFSVGSAAPTEVTKAVLIAPTTSTHAVNTSQRYLDLEIVNRSLTKLSLKAPASGAAATPGKYMLFLLNARGVPSMAKWVQLNPNV
jgi:hypothetical protein